MILGIPSCCSEVINLIQVTSLIGYRQIRFKSGVSNRDLVLQYYKLNKYLYLSSDSNYVFPNACAHVRVSCKQVKFHELK